MRNDEIASGSVYLIVIGTATYDDLQKLRAAFQAGARTAFGLVVWLERPEIVAGHPKELRDYVSRLTHEVIGPLVITTHSPVVLDLFQHRPEDVYIWREKKWVQLTSIFSRDYLNDFSLGNMYMGGQFDD